MTKEEIRDRILAILRDSCLAGSNRQIVLSAPLGEDGLGLDSLALVQFITALEKNFEIVIPDTIWMDRGQMSLDDIIDLVDKISGRPKKIVRQRSDFISEKKDLSRSEKVRQVSIDRGIIGALSWIITKLALHIWHYIYETDKYIVLLFDLEKQAIPHYKPEKKISFRLAVSEDAERLREMWPESIRRKKLNRFEHRLAVGYYCYLAEVDSTIAAIDWVTATEDFEPYTGLHLKFGPGHCYGLDLDENNKFRGQGFGLATLAYSLDRSKTQGFNKQYTIVHAKNDKMLIASIQLLGFRKAGHIKTKRIFRRPNSSWQINSKEGRGRFLTL